MQQPGQARGPQGGQRGERQHRQCPGGGQGHDDDGDQRQRDQPDQRGEDRVGERSGQGRPARGNEAEVMHPAFSRGRPRPADDPMDLFQRGVRIEAGGDHGVLRIGHGPGPEGAHVPAVRFEQDLVVEDRVVQRGDAQRRVLGGDALGADSHRLLEGRLAGRILVRLRLARGDRLLPGLVLRLLPFCAAGVEGDPRDLGGEGVDQGPGSIHAAHARLPRQLALEPGQPEHVVGAEQLPVPGRLDQHHDRVGAEEAPHPRLVEEGRRARVDEQVDPGVGGDHPDSDQGEDGQDRRQGEHHRPVQGPVERRRQAPGISCQGRVRSAPCPKAAASSRRGRPPPAPR